MYLSLLVELLFFSVPSEVSTYQLLFKKKQSNQYSLLKKFQSLSDLLKILLLVIPALIFIASFCFPLVLLFFNNVKETFAAWSVLQSELFEIIGIILVVLGRFVTFHAVLILRKTKKESIDERSLIKKGLFSISRNPIVVGLHLTFLGLLLLFPYYVMIAGFLVFIANMHFKILLEEDYMKVNFGSDFREYMNKTKRYF